MQKCLHSSVKHNTAKDAFSLLFFFLLHISYTFTEFLKTEVVLNSTSFLEHGPQNDY